MFGRLKAIEERFDELEQLLASPEVVQDRPRYTDLSREHSELRELVELSRQRSRAGVELEEAQALAADADAELAAMAGEEGARLGALVEDIDARIKVLLVPSDPVDRRNAVLEVRAGTGGDEAALFAGDLLRMYERYAERRGWKVESLSANSGSKGGIKEAVVNVLGRDAYGCLRREAGVHRVQRVPETESQGRIHTSAVTVAVLPEAEPLDLKVADNDIRVDVYRSSGPGGQSVNTTDSAVRLTHEPTGLVVTCQDEKSQHKNKARAMKILLARLFDLEEQKRHQAEAADRRAMVGSGDRSERVRTYNFPQGRISDHRIGMTVHNLEAFLDGEIDDVVDALAAAEQAARLLAEDGS